MGIECKILKDFGTVANHNGVELKLRKIKWGKNTPVYDLRAWQKDYAKGGLTLSAYDVKQLRELIASLNLGKSVTPEVTTQKRGRPAKAKELVKTDVIPKDIQAKLDALKVAPKKENIIEFPKPLPEIKKVVTKGNATYADCVKKLGKDKAVFVDDDSQYVIDGLLELCKVDADFCNNVMREGKDFSGALNYMADMCRKGYGYKAKNWGFVDKNLGLSMAIDYFNSEDAPKTEIVKTETKAKTKGRKKKGA